MKPIWIICRSYLRRKKIQNGLIALLIMLSTLLLTTASLVFANTGNLYKEMHNKTAGAHQILTMGDELHDPRLVHKWWDEQSDVQATALIPFRNLDGLTYNGQEISNIYMFMMNTPEQPANVDKLIFAQGTETMTPAKGTIWIPTSLAYTHGITEGDTLTFQSGSRSFELSVSGIVVDLAYGSPFTINARIWMNSEDYDRELASLPGSDQYMMGLRYEDYSQSPVIWERFESYLGTPYLETKSEFEELSSFYLIINKVIGFIMIFLGSVMMLVALFTVAFTVSEAIMTHYRTIGIVRSLGLTSKQTVAAYVLQYGLIALAAVIPGVLISRLLAVGIVSRSLQYLKTGDNLLQIQGLSLGWAVGCFIFLLVLISVWLYAGKARKVQPVQAIRYGMSEAEYSRMARRLNPRNKNSRLSFGRIPVTGVIALRNLNGNRKAAAVMLLLTTVSSAVLVLGFVLLYSIINIGRTSALWGYDDAPAVVTVFNQAAFSGERFEADMKLDSRVKSVGWNDDMTGVFPLEDSEVKDDRSRSLNVYVGVLEGGYEEFGFASIQGDNPRNGNEIALGFNLARTLGKVPGDMVEIYLEGHKLTLTVSGIYQAISNMSFSARVTADTVRSYRPDYREMEMAYLNLYDKSQADEIVQDLNRKYGDSLSAVTQQTLLDSVYKEAEVVLIAPMGFMGLLFCLVTFLIIYSFCRIQIRKESKTYGIYKSLGMTSRKIRAAVSLGIGVLSLIGAFIGSVCGVYLLPRLLEQILVSYGLVRLPLLLNGGGIAVVALVSVIVALLGSWLSSRIVVTTSARDLAAE
ncbi:FtsX-like permease family protein [Paenibacillus vini]|uniref:FtsX-like permease family protein n=1 Tax=Paenibacillus vini TaxID=1476024 RepID=UPI0025B6E6F7|nr:ABC transporter permease [Paenibacillus vini]MDN4068693.1 FtsX-like permease family protein [Paenibacillus vini]